MSGAGMGNSLSGLAYFASNEDDPYITLKSVVSTVCVLQCVDLTIPGMCPHWSLVDGTNHL